MKNVELENAATESVKQALKSGRFDYMEDMWDDDSEEMSWEEVCEIVELEAFIEKVSYPFYLVESEN